ncbi:hypothetical protein KP509_25G019900 [Ceratopteris richardii]|uniref:Uncharacterized protein n=1 Tax=Ceratopteris richardii TaxID=49495 RepID=A0A8T2RND2_CERRI|nr:hypothetical protein KP509_25G019900 [Ceratopteris richardii]
MKRFFMFFHLSLEFSILQGPKVISGSRFGPEASLTLLYRFKN